MKFNISRNRSRVIDNAINRIQSAIAAVGQRGLEELDVVAVESHSACTCFLLNNLFAIIGVDSDAKIQKRKGKNRPLIPENERYEIEGVIISRKGIFSIVSRTWEENITGGIDDEVWTVKGENKKNPLKVNELNKTYLLNLLNNEYEIRAITLIKSLSSINFMHESLYDLDSFVNEYALHSPMILSSEDIEKVYNELIKYKVTTDEIIALRKEKGDHVL